MNSNLFPSPIYRGGNWGPERGTDCPRSYIWCMTEGIMGIGTGTLGSKRGVANHDALLALLAQIFGERTIHWGGQEGESSQTFPLVQARSACYKCKGLDEWTKTQVGTYSWPIPFLEGLSSCLLETATWTPKSYIHPKTPSKLEPQRSTSVSLLVVGGWGERERGKLDNC